MHKRNKKVSHVQPLSVVDFLFPALCRQIYTVSGNQDGGDTYIQPWKMVRFPLVIRLTTGGFHVKHYCLISEYMSLSVLHFIAITVYNVCRKWLRRAAQKKCTACSFAF